MKCRKLTALLLTAAMTASILVGCGGQEGTGSSTGGSEPAETSGGGKMRRPKPVIAAIKKLLISRCLLLCQVPRSMTAMKSRKSLHRRPV